MMQGSDGRFRPNDSLTREEAGKIIVTAYEMKTGQTVQDAGELSFEDTDAVSEWAVEYLSKAVSLGFLKGMPENRLEPAGAVSRAQAAAMLNRFLKSAA